MKSKLRGYLGSHGTIDSGLSNLLNNTHENQVESGASNLKQFIKMEDYTSDLVS